MSNAETPDETFVLAPPPPVRTLAISAGAAVVGAGLIVGSAAADLGIAWRIVGMAILIFGVLLGATGLLLMVRFRTTVTSRPEVLVLIRGRQERTVRWSKITEVSFAAPRLTLRVTGEEPVVLVNLRRPGDVTFRRLLVTLQRRLDASRGYGAVPF